MPWILDMPGFWIWHGYRGVRIYLIMFEYIWTMCEYVWICLDVTKYIWVYQNKKNSEHVRVLSVLDAVHSLRPPHKLLSIYRNRGVFRNLSNMERLAKIIVPIKHFCICSIYYMNIGIDINTVVNFNWL